MKNYTAQYFTKKERRSLLLIGGLILCSIGSMYIIYHYDKPTLYRMDEIVPKSIIDSIGVVEKNEKHKAYKKNFHANEKGIIKRTKFNPNTVSVDSLRKMGVDKFASGNLEKYRQKGGKIKSKAQFFKIYGMQKYESILDSLVQIDDTFAHKKSNENFENGEVGNRDKTKKYASSDSLLKKNAPYNANPAKIAIVKIKIIELNTADSFELESVRGIGAYLASRIVKYRNKLGGFYEVDQLEEVYGLRPETYMNINHLVKADVDLIKKIKINSIDEAVLASHPYIGRKTSAILMRYKKQHGDFKTMDDLQRVKIFDEEDLARLKWYIVFE
jgi:competence protein ComEA